MPDAMKKGWFKIPGVQDGDRTLEQQMRGLGPLLNRVSGKNVLDLGCAEGLISKALLEGGARSVCGVSHVETEIEEARRQCAGLRAVFIRHDLNDVDKITFPKGINIVLMLAILHKVQKPQLLTEAVKALGADLIVVRTASATPGFIQDARSGDVRYGVEALLKPHYKLEHSENGPFDEWTGYFEKKATSGLRG